MKADKQITAKQGLIIDDSGQKLGVMSIPYATKMANEKGLSLVEVSEGSVYKFMDLGKEKYKESKKSKPKEQKIKEIKINVKIGEADLQTKLRHAAAFLDKNMKVNIFIEALGRWTMDYDLVRAVKSALAGYKEIKEIKDNRRYLISFSGKSQ